MKARSRLKGGSSEENMAHRAMIVRSHSLTRKGRKDTLRMLATPHQKNLTISSYGTWKTVVMARCTKSCLLSISVRPALKFEFS